MDFFNSHFVSYGLGEPEEEFGFGGYNQRQGYNNEQQKRGGNRGKGSRNERDYKNGGGVEESSHYNR